MMRGDASEAVTCTCALLAAVMDNGARLAYKVVAPMGANTSEEKTHGQEKQSDEAIEEREEARNDQDAPSEDLN